jgi:hypothetical protein
MAEMLSPAERRERNRAILRVAIVVGAVAAAGVFAVWFLKYRNRPRVSGARGWSLRFEPAFADPETAEDMERVLVKQNTRYLRANRRTPPLYRSGVRYEADEPRCQAENWLPIPEVMRQYHETGRGTDCKNLAAWRAAELRDKGVNASVRVVRTSDPDMLHAIVVHPNGRTEDPSKRLGMP